MKEKLTKKVRHTNASSDFYSIQLSNSRLGRKLSETFGLEIEENSKYARGIALIEKIKD